MQLFITDFEQQGNFIILTEERVVHQLSKVLRAKKGEQIAVQKGQKRIVGSIFSIEKNKIVMETLYEEEKNVTEEKKFLAVALPNKFEKMELIVQKCSEIGLENIVFFVSKHSLLKEISETKMQRLEKISLEAIEQSWGREIPNIVFEKNIFSFCEGKNIFISHQHGQEIINHKSNIINISASKNNIPLIMLVGPEGGRHADEESMFEKMQAEKISFGDTIFRTETAAIISGRGLKNIL